MNFLSSGDLTPARLRSVLDQAAAVKRRPQEVAGALSGRSIGLFFAKPSVRTWVSCDVAASQLGAHPVILRNEEAGLGTRETPEDFGRVLARYLDLVAMRVHRHDQLERIAAVVKVPLVNLLSDREHPCQALADLQTMEEFRPLAETTLAYVGDGNNVAHSLILAAAMAGVRVRVATPPGHAPAPEVVTAAGAYGPVELTNEPREAVTGAQVVYTDVWTSMGQEAEAAERRKLFSPFQVDARLFGVAAPDAVFLHCLPAHRGEEVTDEVMEHPRSAVFQQAENRLHSFKAVLLHLLA